MHETAGMESSAGPRPETLLRGFLGADFWGSVALRDDLAAACPAVFLRGDLALLRVGVLSPIERADGRFFGVRSPIAGANGRFFGVRVGLRGAAASVSSAAVGSGVGVLRRLGNRLREPRLAAGRPALARAGAPCDGAASATAAGGAAPLTAVMICCTYAAMSAMKAARDSCPRAMRAKRSSHSPVSCAEPRLGTGSRAIRSMPSGVGCSCLPWRTM